MGGMGGSGQGGNAPPAPGSGGRGGSGSQGGQAGSVDNPGPSTGGQGSGGTGGSPNPGGTAGMGGSSKGGAPGGPPGAGGATGKGGSGGPGAGGRGGSASGGSGGTSMPPPMGGTGGSPPAQTAACSVTKPNATGNEPGGVIPVCCTPNATDKTMIDEAFALLNAHRMANGRSALAYDTKLEQAIQGHCQHMAQHSFFDHGAPESSVSKFTDRAQACGASAFGENIAYNQRTAAQVTTGWKNSSGHNMNMLNTSYKRVGIGLSQWRWGQIFGR